MIELYGLVEARKSLTLLFGIDEYSDLNNFVDLRLT